MVDSGTRCITPGARTVSVDPDGSSTDFLRLPATTSWNFLSLCVPPLTRFLRFALPFGGEAAYGFSGVGVADDEEEDFADGELDLLCELPIDREEMEAEEESKA